MKKPFKISQIDFDKLLYSDPVTRNGKKNIMFKYLHNDEQTDFLIQTPELVCVEKPKLVNNIYEISLELRSKSQKKINNFINFVNELDKKIINLSNSNESWFNSSNGIYHKIIRDDPKYKNGILKIKVKNTSDLSRTLKVSKNNQKEKSSIDKIKENSKVKVVLDVFGLWVKPGKESANYFGIYLKPLLIDFKEDIEEEISFIEESESENNNEFDILDTEVKDRNDNQEEINTDTSILKIMDTNFDEAIKENSDSNKSLQNREVKNITLTLDIDRFAENSDVSEILVKKNDDSGLTENVINKLSNENLTTDSDDVNEILVKKNDYSELTKNVINKLSNENLTTDSDDENDDENIIAHFDNNSTSSEKVVKAS